MHGLNLGRGTALAGDGDGDGLCVGTYSTEVDISRTKRCASGEALQNGVRLINITLGRTCSMACSSDGRYEGRTGEDEGKMCLHSECRGQSGGCQVPRVQGSEMASLVHSHFSVVETTSWLASYSRPRASQESLPRRLQTHGSKQVGLKGERVSSSRSRPTIGGAPNFQRLAGK